MPHYSDEIIEEVRSRNDIVDVISQYVRLQKKGSTYFGLCPFHNEKTGSFSVSPHKQMYYCFGCGAGGNVFTFLMKYENYTFGEVMEALAERSGVELPKQEYSQAQRREADRRMRLLEINKEAAKYFYALLRNDRGRRALEYFRKRELTDETMRKFGLGYSDQYSDDLYKYLRSKGYEDDILKDSGLVTIDEARGANDKFWNRAMFPIMDVHNKVIGFGGRVMGDGEPKYLNSPETKIFDKSRNLYGLNIARATKRSYLLLCEGYMDVIALHQAGFDNAVASLGTSLTSGHANLLKRYTKEVYITYDSDGAGVKAALRAIPILREVGITTRVVNMKPYKDPDEFIKALGADAYQERIDNASNSFLFEISILEGQYDLKDPEGKTSFYNETAKRLCRFTEKLERDNYIEALAGKYHIAAEDLRRLVNKYGASAENVRNQARQQYTDDAYETERRIEKEKKKKSGNDGMRKSQRLLLTWLIDDTSLFDKIKDIITSEDFTEEIYHKAADILFTQYRDTGGVNPAAIISVFPEEEEQAEVAGLFNASIHPVESEEERRKAFWETVIRVKENSIEKRNAALDSSDNEGFMKLIEDKKVLEKLRRQILS